MGNGHSMIPSMGWMSNLPSLPFFGTEWYMSMHSGCMEESLSLGGL